MEENQEEKNLWWIPALFESAEELQNKVDEYFEKWYRKKKVN